jgi:hypothetical protein
MKVSTEWRRARASGVVVGRGPETSRINGVETMSRSELGNGGGDDSRVGRKAAFDGIDGFAVVGCLTGESRGMGDGDVLCLYLLPHRGARGWRIGGGCRRGGGREAVGPMAPLRLGGAVFSVCIVKVNVM